MKRSFIKYRIFLYIMIFIALIGILIGSFLDLSISKGIVNQNDFLGKTVETFGMIPGFMLINVGGVLLFKGLKGYNKKWTKVLGYALLVISFIVSTYLSYSKGLTKTDRIDYGLKANAFIVLAFSIISSLIGTGLSLLLIKSEDRILLMTVGTSFILVVIFQYATVEILKSAFNRPRYRFLIDDALNVDGITFKNWFEFGKVNGNGDYYKSWPSGHTSLISSILILPLISVLFKDEERKCFIITWVLSSFIVFSVMFYRIRVGAHFLSDVSTGLLISLIYEVIMVIIVQKINERHNKTVLE